MKKYILTLSSLGAFCLIAVMVTSTATAAPAKPQGKTAWNTKPTGAITPWAAMSIAAKASGGKPFQALFEFDEGKWSYGVMVVKNHKLYEVEIDPQSGKIGDTEGVTADGEANEMKSDFAKALKTGG